MMQVGCGGGPGRAANERRPDSACRRSCLGCRRCCRCSLAARSRANAAAGPRAALLARYRPPQLAAKLRRGEPRLQRRGGTRRLHASLLRPRRQQQLGGRGGAGLHLQKLPLQGGRPHGGRGRAGAGATVRKQRRALRRACARWQLAGTCRADPLLHCLQLGELVLRGAKRESSREAGGRQGAGTSGARRAQRAAPVSGAPAWAGAQLTRSRRCSPRAASALLATSSTHLSSTKLLARRRSTSACRPEMRPALRSRDLRRGNGPGGWVNSTLLPTQKEAALHARAHAAVRPARAAERHWCQ